MKRASVVLVFLAVLIAAWLVKSPFCAAEKKQASHEAEGGSILFKTRAAKKAARYKKEGDRFYAKKQYKKAAPFYLKALRLDRDGFSIKQRIKMADCLRLSGGLGDAEDEFARILARAPGNEPARLELARILSWENKLSGAIRQCDLILAGNHAATDALVLKANCIRWQGDYPAAIRIYRRILAGSKDNFDARIGLAYADISGGQLEDASAQIQAARPFSPFTRKNLAQLKNYYFSQAAPLLYANYSYYRDTDHELQDDYTSGFGMWAGGVKLNLDYEHISAYDPWTGRAHMDRLSLNAAKPLGEYRIMAGVGAADLQNKTGTDLITGQLDVNRRLGQGRLGVEVSRDVFTYDAFLIDNRTTYRTVQAYFWQTLAPRLHANAEFDYRRYSDSNYSREWKLSAKYYLRFDDPKVAAIYSLDHLDFNTQTGSGYFDPKHYLSNQLYATVRQSFGHTYFNVEAYGGYQSFSNFDQSVKNTVFGATGFFGWNLSKRFTVETHAEWSNFQQSTGFEYYILGIKLLARL